jgi:putative nucleotide binding protein
MGMSPPAKRYEDYALVLDFLPYGRPSGRGRHTSMPIAQLIGETFFTLLEAEVKRGCTLSPHERIYVGRDFRDKISRIMGRIDYEELTASAKAELESAVEELVRGQEKRFVEFFNEAQAITPRMHALELLPGIGKKIMWQIINEREKAPFKSFKDIQDRAGIPDPAKLIAKRIVKELSGESKYRLFVRAD